MNKKMKMNIAFTPATTVVHYYSIGGHTIGIEASVKLPVSRLLPTFEPFAVNPSLQSGNSAVTPPFCLFVLRIGQGLNRLADERKTREQAEIELTHFEWQGANCTISKGTKEELNLHIVTPDGIQEGDMKIEQGCRAITWLPAETEAASFVLSNFLMMLYTFAAARCYTLLMHASVIRQQGKAYLFLGRSGTGKSTHSALWLRHIRGSELLNDDNPILRIDPHKESVTVYGSPWSGKTPCYRPEQVPVAAIVRLSQAPHNQMERQETAHAFAALLPSCSCLKQDNDIYNGILQTVCSIVQHTPIYRLECLPNKEAAELCYRTAAMQAETYTPDDVCL